MTRAATPQKPRHKPLTRWLAAALTAAAVATAAYATASYNSYNSHNSHNSTTSTNTASLTAASSNYCLGVTKAIAPAQGFIADPARTQGGHFWWHPTQAGVCVGTVVEWVRYNSTATKTWRVLVYDTAHPDGQVVASRTFTLGRGSYFWNFGVHQAYQGLTAVCLTADDSFGMACASIP
jgi:hypothetical protein